MSFLQGLKQYMKTSFNTGLPCVTRAGGRAEVLHEYSTHLVTQWFDGIRWHLSEHNLDGTYGLKTIPEYLKGRSSGKFELFALQQKDVPKSLDLINDTETPNLVA